MIAHFSGKHLGLYNRTWAPILNLIAKDLKRRGYTITRDGNLLWWREPDDVHVGNDENADVIIYPGVSYDSNHTKGLYVGLTGPDSGYFSIDRQGVWPELEQTYNKRDDDIVMESNFYHNEFIELLKDSKTNHFNNEKLNLGKKSPVPDYIPEDHVLVLVSDHDSSWNHSWKQLKSIVNKLLEQNIETVIKYDPSFLLSPNGELDEEKEKIHGHVIEEMAEYTTVFTGLESLHDILPKSKIVIMDEKVKHLEPLYYLKPIITHGAPPYRHVVKQIYHLNELIPAIQDNSWFDKNAQYQWTQWFIMKYLCSDIESVSRRLDELLEPLQATH